MLNQAKAVSPSKNSAMICSRKHVNFLICKREHSQLKCYSQYPWKHHVGKDKQATTHQRQENECPFIAFKSENKTGLFFLLNRFSVDNRFKAPYLQHNSEFKFVEILLVHIFLVKLVTFAFSDHFVFKSNFAPLQPLKNSWLAFALSGNLLQNPQKSFQSSCLISYLYVIKTQTSKLFLWRWYLSARCKDACFFWIGDVFTEWKVSDEQYVSNSSELLSKCTLSWLTGDETIKSWDFWSTNIWYQSWFGIKQLFACCTFLDEYE